MRGIQAGSTTSPAIASASASASSLRTTTPSFPDVKNSEVPVASVLTAQDFSLPLLGIGGTLREGAYELLSTLGTLPAQSGALQQARAAAGRTEKVFRDLQGFASGSSPVPYPTDPLATKLAGLAAMIDAGLPLRCVSVQGTEGYDTHAAQGGVFGRNFKAAADSLLAFQRDLEARGLADRVLVQVWSEFGRRPQENGSGGTDHGAGGVAFVIGTAASGLTIGEFPGLAQLDPLANLRSTSDFRGLYAALLEQWLGVDAEPIIPDLAGIERPQLLKL